MAAKTKSELRKARRARIRRKISGTGERPRFSVFRSARYLYVQVIDDMTGRTICTASSLEPDLKKGLKSCRSIEAAKEVGKLIASRAKEKKVEKVVFDRSGYIYHGRVKALAEGAREAGLNF
ncbi:MAG: 50S ribosomal protein L18 [Bradymonadales bacterium]|nr:MAG: 50S ribosomal protein L18 [Bradymonadales bacterium]